MTLQVLVEVAEKVWKAWEGQEWAWVPHTIRVGLAGDSGLPTPRSELLHTWLV